MYTFQKEGKLYLFVVPPQKARVSVGPLSIVDTVQVRSLRCNLPCLKKITIIVYIHTDTQTNYYISLPMLGLIIIYTVYSYYMCMCFRIKWDVTIIFYIQDLKSSNMLEVSMALVIICRLIGAEMIPAVLPLVRDKLLHPK